jgi:hypothetical protein
MGGQWRGWLIRNRMREKERRIGVPMDLEMGEEELVERREP